MLNSWLFLARTSPLPVHYREQRGLRGAIAGLREDLNRSLDRVARIEHSQAHLEGFLEGLREAIVAAARENPNPSDGS